MRPTLILGLGNLLQGDDGIGCRVAQELERRALPDHVEVIDAGTPGIGLLNLLAGRERAIIVDAAELGQEPGSIQRFGADDVLLTGSDQRISLHRTGIADSLALARELNMPLPKIIFFGVQPAVIDWQDGLSPPMQAAVSQVIQAIWNEINRS